MSSDSQRRPVRVVLAGALLGMAILVLTILVMARHVGAEPSVLQRALKLRLAGELEKAQQTVEHELHRPDLAVADEVELRLELAKILDRIGLHTHTRPVEEALAQIESAEARSVGLRRALRGRITMQKANYYYRAEMTEREFPLATTYAESAIALLRDADAPHALSEAVHLLGLIEMQKRHLPRARELFDESLTIDEEAGARAWMLGEYHRHVGFLFMFDDNWSAALPHFEQSLRFRKEAGATDASLFAAVSLATALVRTGQPALARAPLEYAIAIAESIPSPVGMARASIVLGEVLDTMGEKAEAKAAYSVAREAARGVGYDSLANRAAAALEALDRTAQDGLRERRH